MRSSSGRANLWDAYRCRAMREQLEICQAFSPESQGQNVALTVLFVPSLSISINFRERANLRDAHGARVVHGLQPAGVPRS